MRIQANSYCIPGFGTESVEELRSSAVMDRARPGSGVLPNLKPLNRHIEKRIGRRFPKTSVEDREDIASAAVTAIWAMAHTIEHPDRFVGLVNRIADRAARAHYEQSMSVAQGKAPAQALAEMQSTGQLAKGKRVPLDRFTSSLDQPVGDDDGTTLADLVGTVDDSACLSNLFLEEIVGCVRRHTTDREYEAFTAVYVDGLSSIEAAERLGITSDRVRALLSSMRRHVRGPLLAEGLVGGDDGSTRSA